MGERPIKPKLRQKLMYVEGQHIGNTIQKGNQYTGRTLNFQPVGFEDGSTSCVGRVTDNSKNIVMNVDENTKRNRVHEIFHTFGFSHPKGSGGTQEIMKYPPSKPSLKDAWEFITTPFLPTIKQKMKYVFTLILLLNAGYCHARKQGDSLFAGEYTYVEFIRPGNDIYPLVFAAAFKQDTITVNLASMDLFIKSIYSLAPCVPLSNSAYEKCYETIYGYSRDVFDDCALFINEFNCEFNRLKHKGYILLATGEKVYYYSCGIRGVFLVTNKDKFWHNAQSSMSILAPTYVDEIIVPIAVSNYKKRRIVLKEH